MEAAYILICPSVLLRISSPVWSSLFYEHKTASLMQCVELISSINNTIPFAEY
jgi:hypothetical protein